MLDKSIARKYEYMKKIIGIFLICILGLVGCGKSNEEKLIMVDGVLYEVQYAMPAEIDQSAIVGDIEYYTEAIPTKDGETNISEDLIGEPYAKVIEGIAILYQNEWWFCKEKTDK